MYHVDADVPFFRLLTTVVRPSRCSDYTLKENLLAIGWEENGSYRVNIRKISCSPKEEEAEAVLNLGNTEVSRISGPEQ